MCGIIGMFNKSMTGKRVIDTIQRVYEHQKERGGESFGIAIANPGAGIVRRRGLFIKEVLNPKVAAMIGRGSFVVFHHRMATSTANHELLGHPFISEDGKVALVHNGIVSGYEAKREVLERKGHRFESEHVEKEMIFFPGMGKREVVAAKSNVNDSEVLLHTYEDEGIRGCISTDMGMVAVAIIDTAKDAIILARNTAPMKFRKYTEATVFASNLKNGKDLPAGASMRIDRNGDITTTQEVSVPIQTPLVSDYWKKWAKYDGYDTWEDYNNDETEESLTWKKKETDDKEALMELFDQETRKSRKGMIQGWY